MRAQGIGGVFLYSTDPEALARWYAECFDLALEQWGKAWGCELPSADREPSPRKATTTFSVFPTEPAADASAAAPRRVMINWRVGDLDEAAASLEAAGCTVERIDGGDYGRFARTEDPDGHGVELWEPPTS